jgi:hypothetical protein
MQDGADGARGSVQAKAKKTLTAGEIAKLKSTCDQNTKRAKTRITDQPTNADWCADTGRPPDLAEQPTRTPDLVLLISMTLRSWVG